MGASVRERGEDGRFPLPHNARRPEGKRSLDTQLMCYDAAALTGPALKVLCMRLGTLIERGR